ncbi:CheR family methyltransferase [Stakelama marina]|uniref:Protein-glutamate O-methyltransferase CheR n=1 Tax=Stakelama marina TaxID=2826939 RepID=A0A8T4IFQ7_9SPHN|nr:protein-glutamate O-methyltransferase CheR [Stakelama marina]MBR0551895.1 protein-glutamate O-methyltransferase CheR [Stakelama marina]
MGVIAAMLEQRTGQQIAANRSWRIETALKPILRKHRLETLDELVAALMAGQNGNLAETVVDAMLNQETSFFRDAAVLDQIADAVVALQQTVGGRRLRIWCAGCSTGQEPYSLAILLSERLGDASPTFPEIVATDISAAAISRARNGRYSQFEIQRGMPIRRMIRWFDAEGEEWQTKAELTRLIQFRKANLVGDQPPPGRFDVILCRNVLMYFSAALRRRVFCQLAESIRPEGLLVLGAGETVIGQTELLKPSQQFRGMYTLAPAKDAASHCVA